MTETDIRELIEQLRTSPFASVLTDKAADALESMLWKPIADMPEELKDGRQVLMWSGRDNRYVIDHYLNGVWFLEPYSLPYTHYIKITSPNEGE